MAYIDEKKLKSKLKYIFKVYGFSDILKSKINNALENSTADVVEVVRCCDCKHRIENPDINNTCYLTCNKKWGLQGIVDPTDFCSYGENALKEREK